MSVENEETNMKVVVVSEKKQQQQHCQLFYT